MRTVNRVFVYGTLRSDAKNSMHSVLAKYSKFEAKGYVYGTLYDVGDYPAIVLDSVRSKVYGEVYIVYDMDRVFGLLDEYEECSSSFAKPHEYRRVQAEVFLDLGKRVESWVYEYNLPPKGLKAICEGDYMEYLKSRKR